MGKIKICAVSDLHGYLPEITDSCDLFLIAGDISPIYIQFQKLKMTEWVLDEFAEWVKSIPADKVVFVPGNHDAWFESASKTDIDNLLTATNYKLIYLKNENWTYKMEDTDWHIFGTPYCHIFGNWPFMRKEEYMVSKFSEMSENVDIIVSHDPPFACGDVDVIMEAPQHRNVRLFEHLGNKPLADRIQHLNHKLHVCGHIHGGDHTFSNVWRTVNVSHLDEYYTPAYPPFYIELEK
jgi:Icc-related predicted phosphoesterase